MKYRIEPELKYCPRCRDEYRADIATCATCAVELLTGREVLDLKARQEPDRRGRSMHIQESDELVDIRKGAVLEIKQIQARLARQNIPSLLVGDSQSCGKGCCGSEVLLRVRKNDVEEVSLIFQKEYVSSTGLLDHDLRHVDAVINPQADQTICPACGHNFSAQGSACPDCGLCF